MTESPNVQASILDRLIDSEPDVTQEPFRRYTVAQIKESVARDLENLLNSRRNILPVPAGYKEIHNSLFAYGLPDFTSKNPANVSVRSQLRLEIEKTVSLFEPRLKNVVVHLDRIAHSARDMRFRISAVLAVYPVSEPVVFDTAFDLNRSRYSILK